MPYQTKEEQRLRQFRIIQQLYSMRSLDTHALAQEYSVTRRTIQRDMKSISAVFPLQHTQGEYSLDVDKLLYDSQIFHSTLLNAFAQNIGIDTLCIDRTNITSSKVIFAIEYSSLPKHLGSQIVETIKESHRCSFMYEKPTSISHREADPIKLYTENGRWYLIARDYKDDIIKTFNLSKIKEFKALPHPTTLTKKMLDEADSIKSIWSSSSADTHRVVLSIDSTIAGYIEDIKLHKTQEIVDRHYDGGLEVHCTITHKLEILPTIKSWLPNIHIIEPKWLRDDMMRDLEYFRDEDDKMVI